MKSDRGSPAKHRVAEQGFDALVAWATRISRRQAWCTTALAVALAAFADHVTGSGIWFGPLYLLIICLPARSEEHTSELQSLMRISYAVFCLKKIIHISSITLTT